MALTNKLSAIGDAIRAKTGKSELLTLDAMPAAIGGIETGGGGSIEVEPLVLTGNCNSACKGVMPSAYIKVLGDTVSTKDITYAENMFTNYTNETIPFELNFKSDTAATAGYLFYGSSLKELPAVNNLKISSSRSMFQTCYHLREIPEDWASTWDWSSIHTKTYDGYCDKMFMSCNSLRRIPESFLSQCYHKGNNSNTVYNYGFQYCFALDEIRGLPVHPGALSSNQFATTFVSCTRLKDIIFAMNEDGTPQTAPWTGAQTIDLSNVGWNDKASHDYTKWNSGITNDKQVATDATYQALKNDPDWWAQHENYSRYNHDSAVNTINSLPDASATGKTHTIKFKGTAGSETDGGAINTLTEEEIAVATAKGWTVTLV